ncbi:MAG: hypothetical protein V3S00_03780 [Dehalococcoidia bacterium]
MRSVNWITGAVCGGVALLVLVVGAVLLGGGGGYGMMGPGMMWGFAPFGWMGMILMWLVPLTFLGLLVAGIVWLVRTLGRPGQGHPGARTCPNGHAVQADWRACPYCGAELA